MRLTESTRSMLGLKEEEEGENIEVGQNRLQKDEEDVQLLSGQSECFRVFEHGDQDLVCILTNDVAPQEVKTDILSARKRGQKILDEFVAQRIAKDERGTLFYERLSKQNSKTFASVHAKQPASKHTKHGSVKADSDLFQKLLIAAESGRKADLDKLLQSELMPSPHSLAHPHGSLRSTDKAALGRILEEGLVTANLLNWEGQTRCIIDRMALV